MQAPMIFKNQLDQKSMDGLPDLDSHMECCACCIAGAVEGLTGKRCEGEYLLHQVYGKGYMGGTAALAYVDFVQKQYGVRLRPINGTGSYLVSQIHEQIKLGHPVIGTIPSTYAPPGNPLDPGPSHCIAFYQENPGAITAMNPWRAFAQSGTDNWWAQRLCFNQIWVVEKEEKPMIAGWKDDGETLIAPNGHKVVKGFRAYVLANNWHPENVPIEGEHASASGGTEQAFTYTLLTWQEKAGVHEAELGVLYRKQEDQGQVISDLQAKLKHLGDINDHLNEELDQLKKQAPKAPPASLLALLKTFADAYTELEGK